MKLLNGNFSAVPMAEASNTTRFRFSKCLTIEAELRSVNVSTGLNSATRDKFPN